MSRVARLSLAQNAGVGARCVNGAFGVGNTMVVYPTSGPKEERDPSHYSEDKPSLLFHRVSWETSLYGPIYRKLVNESSQAFFSLQKMAREQETVSTAQLVNTSRQYRSVIRDCQEQLDSSEDCNSADSQHHSELLYKLELIWNLVEILCIEKGTIGIVLPQLLDWISGHFPQADEKARDVLEESPEQPETHAAYWEAIILFLTQGRKEQALSLLRLHSEFGQPSSGDGFASLDELIRKLPLYAGPTMSAVDFDFRWKHWQKEVVARLDEGDFSSSPNLTRIAQLMAGSEQAFNDLVPLCETWYQWMTGKLLFQSPDVKAYDLAFHAQKAIDKFGGLGTMTSLDSVLLATMETDLAQVMHELCTTLDNFWFPSHLLDLLYHADQLDNMGHHDASNNEEKPIMQPGPGLREFLLLEYSTCLMSHKSLWQLGALYLDHCPTQGRYRLEALLQRMPLDTERKANKVIALASDRGMVGVVNKVCKIMGMRALRIDRIGTAMAWAIRSQDVRFTTFLADQLLKRYCDSGEFSSADLLDHLGHSMVVSDRLTFLAKYREFHKLCEQGDFATAANMLHSLMWSRLAPKYFWVTLLIDAIPFISLGEDSLLTSEQTYEIMHCLQELTKDPTLPKKQRLLLDEHEPQIRMHLAKNLAVALMEEGDANDENVF